MALLMGGLALSGCGSDAPQKGQIGFISEDFGGVVSDEPRSAGGSGEEFGEAVS